MSRTKAFEPAEALDHAMELFWRQGYTATPLDQLVRHTGASRYGLYATFGGKRDLFLTSLERYSQAVMDPMLQPLEDARASTAEIRRFFDRVLDVIRRPGRRGARAATLRSGAPAADAGAQERTTGRARVA